MVILVDHDPGWRYLFQEEASLLREVFSCEEYEGINHIGSTSVFGIKAKPVIDISVGMKSLMDVGHYADKLLDSEYKYCQDDFGKWMLFKKEGKHKFNLHIMHHDNSRYAEQLIFRDALRSDSQLLKAYERRKILLEREEIAWYAMGKLGFVDTFFGRDNGFRLSVAAGGGGW